jgi:hypothetical protein
MAGHGAAFQLASASDPTDPYIVAQAAALSNNPTQIFQFVRDQTVFQAYSGSVKGARGTLWSLGGNSLDRASLLIALLGAAGYTAQYVQGTLNSTLAATLINSMFPAPSRVVGCIPTGTSLASPATDPNLLAQVETHFWVQYGNGNTPMDPNFTGSAIGTTYGTSPTTFATIPPALKQMVTVTLNVEMSSGDEFNSAAVNNLGGSPQLTQTFEAALLVGMPISVNNAVAGGTTSFFGITTTTYTYTPTLVLGQGSTDVEKDPIVQGTAYTESYTPPGIGAGSYSYVSGMFLVITAPNSQGVMETYQHTLVDLLGFANRQSGNPTPPTPGNLINPPPIVSPTDVVTINVLPSLQSSAAFTNQQQRVQTEQARFQAQQAALAALPTSGGLTQAQQTTLSQGLATEAYLEISLNELDTMTFAATADHMLPQLESTYLSDAYYNSPRILIGASNSSGVFTLDLVKRDIDVIASPGQNISAPYYFEIGRGMAESSSEAKVLNQVIGPTPAAIGIADVFAQLPTGGAVYINNTLYQDGLVQMPNLSADAQAYIKYAFTQNKAVIAPATTPTVNGMAVNMWLEVDQMTGETVSMSDNGTHEGIGGWIVALLSFFFGKYFTFTQIAGFGVTGYAFAAGVLNGVAAIAGGAKYTKESVAGGGAESPLAPYVEAAFKVEDDLLKKLPVTPVPIPPDSIPPGVEGLLGLVEGLKQGAEESQGVFLRMLPADPDVFDFLSTDIIPGPAPVTPGPTPAVNLTLTQDQFFTQPFSGGDVPTVFVANIQNSGPVTETFNLTVGNIAGYQLIPSVNSITVPAGQTGQIGICAIPTGDAAPPAMLSATASVVGNSSVTSGSTIAVSASGNLTACEVTNDALPSVADVQQMIDEALGASTASHDLNGDKSVNSVDIQIVVNALMGNGCKTS